MKIEARPTWLGYLDNLKKRDYGIEQMQRTGFDHYGNLITQHADKIAGNGSDYETIHKKVYHLHEEDKLFTKREREVLLWMAEGLNSKMIAEKMFVSEHTVINHRRNMQHKTNMPNAIALVSFALKNSIISIK